MYSPNQNALNTTFRLATGIKVKLINEPMHFRARLTSIVPEAEFVNTLHQPVNSIFLFTQSKAELVVELPVISKFVTCEGNLVISVPNMNSNNITDLNDTVLNELAKESSMKLSEKIILDDAWDSYIFLHDNKERI